jgi:HTH-like domain
VRTGSSVGYPLKSRGLVCSGDEHHSIEGFRFVSEYQAEFLILTMCRIPGCAPSGYYAWTKRQPSQRARTDAVLVAEISAAHEASRGTYGAPRIHVDLAAKGIRVGRKRVTWLVSAAGLVGASRRKFVRTTVKGSERQRRSSPPRSERR